MLTANNPFCDKLLPTIFTNVCRLKSFLTFLNFHSVEKNFMKFKAEVLLCTKYWRSRTS